MASLAVACRATARSATKQLSNYGARRALHAGQASMAAQHFTMPALSPTMTEGNIATWKIKEGDSFAAGDVLLDIETDKAQMDVEAQEDGILAKIIMGDGAKSIQVGSRIAVTADPGDDVSSLEMPAEDSPAPKEAESKDTTSRPEEQRANSPPPAQSPKNSSNSNVTKQRYPLYPSVQHILRVNGLAKEEADKIPATGPNGRLLKGDVLAYVGAISDAYPSQLAKRFKTLSHLDLSKIKVAAKKDIVQKASEATKTAAAVEAAEKTVVLPVSLTSLLDCRKRHKDTTGISIPLSTSFARAAKLANQGLPMPKSVKLSPDELFNIVLGLDKVESKKSTRGNFIPKVTMQSSTAEGMKHSSLGRKPDVLDILAGKTAPSRQGTVAWPLKMGEISISVPKEEEARGHLFLKRFKSMVETMPEKLV